MHLLAEAKQHTFARTELRHHFEDSVEGSARKTKWRKEEDEVLASHVADIGVHNWALAAKKLNKLFYGDRLVRQGKHCRERWHNHLDPALKSKL
jgi:hypothetical protein